MHSSCILVSRLIDAYLRTAFIVPGFCIHTKAALKVYVHTCKKSCAVKKIQKYCKNTHFWFSEVQTLQQRIRVQIYIDKRRTSNACKFLNSYLDEHQNYTKDTWIYWYILFAPWSFPKNSLLSILVLLICLFSTSTVCYIFLELSVMTLGFLYCVVTAQSLIPYL